MSYNISKELKRSRGEIERKTRVESEQSWQRPIDLEPKKISWLSMNNAMVLALIPPKLTVMKVHACWLSYA